ncbi:RNA-binding S4 domain-containing protein [Pelagibacterium lentulum]|uniref:RNA-binding S4 domain-containing protein n=1 Tax=Pelagibacterium lentulum TaxID=2029865 RepID=A0A916R5A0_9HYPH|nr:RNA-binding S4 domain-containing protein [Pelagibacterium lentulum]GGA35156.1 hypothetical protein GCM10011499_00550 [Pelagibacterium lentulum]
MPAETNPAWQRLDKWLWFARVVKTRTLAQKLIASGAIRVNGQRVLDADYRIKPDDGLTLVIGSRIRVLKVVGFAQRRGPASAAAMLFEDLSPQLSSSAQKPQS